MKKYILPLLALSAVAFTACENGEQDFPDFEGGTTAYFSYQYPVRTIILGEGTDYSLDNDNAHKFVVYGYGAGTYNPYSFTFQARVEESLCQNLYFENGTPVKALPSSYYQLQNTTSVYDGQRLSGVTVQLTDQFFADPAAITQTYVMPIVMSDVKGAKQILTGTLAEGAEAIRTNENNWTVQPKDFTMVCIKFMNPWEGKYLVKGTSETLLKSTVVSVETASLTTCDYTNADGLTMKLTFGGEKDDNCTISGDGISGSGNYGHGTEKKAFGDKDRNALYLKYTAGGKQYDETLVLQYRGDEAGTVKTYKPVYK